MRQATLIVDGLWYCLCPSFHQIAPRQPFASFISKRACQTRHLAANPTPDVVPGPRHFSKVGGRDRTQRKQISESLSGNQNGDSATRERSSTWAKDARQSADHEPMLADLPMSIRRRSTEDLENFLKREMSENKQRMLTVTAILRVLIGERHIQPKLRHYKALILANTDPRHGWPENIRRLLSEMEENGIAADSSTLHAALQVR